MAPPALPTAKAKESVESTQFHLNRVLTKSPQGKSDANKAFVKTCKAMLEKQAELVKEFFKMGLEWTGKGDVLGTEAPVAASTDAAPEPEVSKPVPEVEKKAEEPEKKGNFFAELSQ